MHQNKHDPKVSETNSEVTSLKQQHRTDIWKEHLNKQWYHNQHTHTHHGNPTCARQ